MQDSSMSHSDKTKHEKSKKNELNNSVQLSKCQPFGVECWLYVREEQRRDRKFDVRSEPAI
jgi:hypothetical protein